MCYQLLNINYFYSHKQIWQKGKADLAAIVIHEWVPTHGIYLRHCAERGQGEEQENEQHYRYILCLGYLATID